MAPRPARAALCPPCDFSETTRCANRLIRDARLHDQRERTDGTHLKEGAEIGATAQPVERLSLASRRLEGFPTLLPAGRTAHGLYAIGTSPLPRLRAENWHGTGALEIQWGMPQHMETHASQVVNQPEQRRIQPDPEQILKFIKSRILRGWFSRLHCWQ